MLLRRWRHGPTLSLTRLIQKEVNKAIAMSRAVVVPAAMLPPLWPALRIGEGVERIKPLAVLKADLVPHRWIRVSKFWRFRLSQNLSL